MKNWMAIAFLSLSLAACKTSQVETKREIASGPNVRAVVSMLQEESGKSEASVLRDVAVILKQGKALDNIDGIKTVDDLMKRLKSSEDEAFNLLRKSADDFARKYNASNITFAKFDQAAAASGSYGRVGGGFDAGGFANVKRGAGQGDQALDNAVTHAAAVDRKIAGDLGIDHTMGKCDNLSAEAVDNATSISENAMKAVRDDPNYSRMSKEEKLKKFKQAREEQYEVRTGQPRKNICHAYGMRPKGEAGAPACKPYVYNPMRQVAGTVTCEN